jgi:hypothetical protein
MVGPTYGPSYTVTDKLADYYSYTFPKKSIYFMNFLRSERNILFLWSGF